MVDFNPNIGLPSIRFQKRSNLPALNGRTEIYGQAVFLKENIGPYCLYLLAREEILKMLDVLENYKYLSDEIIYKNQNAKQILTVLLEESAKNAAIEACKKNVIGAEVQVSAFVQNNFLHIQILDNGHGFSNRLFPKIGNESLSGRVGNNSEESQVADCIKDHLFKMGQLTKILDWELMVNNRKNNNGANISIKIPLLK